MASGKAMAGDEEVKALAQPGEIGNGRVVVKEEGDSAQSRGSIATSTPGGDKQQRGAEYLVRRLKRDAPAIAKQLAAGQFKSARAAAIEAGILTPPTPLDLLRRAWKKATAKAGSLSGNCSPGGTIFFSGLAASTLLLLFPNVVDRRVEIGSVVSGEFVRFRQFCRFRTNLTYRCLPTSTLLCDFIDSVARQPHLKNLFVPRLFLVRAASASGKYISTKRICFSFELVREAG